MTDNLDLSPSQIDRLKGVPRGYTKAIWAEAARVLLPAELNPTRDEQRNTGKVSGARTLKLLAAGDPAWRAKINDTLKGLVAARAKRQLADAGIDPDHVTAPTPSVPAEECPALPDRCIAVPHPNPEFRHFPCIRAQLWKALRETKAEAR